MNKAVLAIAVMLVVLSVVTASCSGGTSEVSKDISKYIVPPASSPWVSPPTVYINNFQAGYIAEDMSSKTFDLLYVPYVTYRVTDYDAKGRLGNDLSAYIYSYMMNSHLVAYYDEIQKAFPKSSISSVDEALVKLEASNCIRKYIDDPVENVPPDKLYLVIHNGYSIAKDKFILTTFKNEYTANIPLKKVLRDGSIESVLKVETFPMQGEKNISEKPVVLSFNAETNKLEIGNLAEDYKRIIEVDYHHNSPTTISLTYKVPDENKTWEGFTVAPPEAVNWVTMPSTEISLLPFETKAVAVSLKAPANVTLPKKWEFQIAVEATGADMVTEICARFLVTMADMPKQQTSSPSPLTEA